MEKYTRALATRATTRFGNKQSSNPFVFPSFWRRRHFLSSFIYIFPSSPFFPPPNRLLQVCVLQRLVNCFHDCYHCMNVRKDSLKARYGGHGLLYGFVAYMLATFASKIVGAAWSMSVPTSGDLTSPRVLDACACWFLVSILTPTRTVWSMYGNGRDSAVARGVLFSGEALNKFKSMTRGVLRSEPSGTLERLFLVATCSAASALSRALTDRYVVSDKPTSSWLMSAFSTMSNEVRKNLVVATVVFIAHDGKSIARVVEYLRCDTDDDFTGGVVGMMKRSYCVVTPENHRRTVELARQSVHLLVFVYILSVFLGKSAKPTAFITKPPPKKAPASPAVKKVQQKNNARRRAQQSGGGGNRVAAAAKKTSEKKTKTE